MYQLTEAGGNFSRCDSERDEECIQCISITVLPHSFQTRVSRNYCINHLFPQTPKWNIIPLATELRVAFPQSDSTSCRANSITVPGPWEVTKWNRTGIRTAVLRHNHLFIHILVNLLFETLVGRERREKQDSMSLGDLPASGDANRKLKTCPTANTTAGEAQIAA